MFDSLLLLVFINCKQFVGFGMIHKSKVLSRVHMIARF